MEAVGRKIALFGAAGAIGQSIAAALRNAGRSYRVVGRTRASLARSFGQDPGADGRPRSDRVREDHPREPHTFKGRMRVEMHDLLTEPVIMDDSALQELIGPIAKTPYPEGIRRTLVSARPTAPAGP